MLLPELLDEPWMPGPTGLTAPSSDDGGCDRSPPIRPLRPSEPLLPAHQQQQKKTNPNDQFQFAHTNKMCMIQ